MPLKLSRAEREKFDILCSTFDENYAALRLFAGYLNEEPDFVTRDIMRELMSEVEVDEEYAFAMVLSALFSLDTENNAEHRRFERKMLIPAVRRLDPSRYTADPYYRNIKIPEISGGEWKFTTETYRAYRGFVCDDILPDADLCEIPHIGYFSEDFSFPAVLEGGNEWMTLTPVDLDTCQEQIASSKGKCITFGLGLGYYTYMVSERREVDSITVIEKSPDVIALFKEYILPQFTNRHKVNIINADALEYARYEMPRGGFDHAYADIWRDVSDGFPLYMKMKQLERYSPNTYFCYWIEGFMLSHLRSLIFDELRTNGGSRLFPASEITTVDEVKHILSDGFLRSLAASRDDPII